MAEQFFFTFVIVFMSNWFVALAATDVIKDSDKALLVWFLILMGSVGGMFISAIWWVWA